MDEEELFCKLFPDYAVNGKPLSPYFDLFESGVEQSENRIEELEKEISVLLSCKSCSENKGGLICAKEYENKCLAQKIEFIKELQQENAELKLKLDALEGQIPWKEIKDKSEVIGKLTTAKEIIRDLLSCLYSVEYDRISDLEEAEQFLNSEVDK